MTGSSYSGYISLRDYHAQIPPLPISLYEVQPPQNKEVDFTTLLLGNRLVEEPQRKVLLYKGQVLHKSASESEILAVNLDDIHKGNSTVQADVYIQNKDDCLQFSWECTEPSLNFSDYYFTTIKLQSADRLVGDVVITLTEEQIEELRDDEKDISEITLDPLVTEIANADESDSKEIEEGIHRCNISARTWSSRNVRAPTRFNGFREKTRG